MAVRIPKPTPGRRTELPDRLSEAMLAAALARRLVPAENRPEGFGAPPAVVWLDAGDEVLVHLSRLRVALRDKLIAVSIDLETDQTGRATLLIPFAVGGPRDSAGLVAATEELPRGNALLVARWGRIVQEAVWSALLQVVDDYATRLGKLAFGFTAYNRVLSLRAAEPQELAALQKVLKAAQPRPR